MGTFTATKEFGPYKNIADGYLEATFIADVGTGSLSVETKSGANWIVAENFSADAVRRISVSGATWRVVVTGDAEYEWFL
tara:strand:- start:441 stop:680 length:240 start_codon:yes stop_codon:yes gene_type:complete